MSEAVNPAGRILFETERLRVRQLTTDDAEAMFAIYGDAEIAQWVGDGAPLIGCCGIVHADDEAQPEIIYAIRRDLWRRGFGGEVVVPMLAYGFESCGLPELFATVDPDNAASIRILVRAGMRYLHTRPDEDGLPTATYWQQRAFTPVAGP